MCMFVVGFQSSPCLDHQMTRNSSHRHMKPRPSLGSHQGWCGLILNSLTWPQRLAMNSGIKFRIVLHYNPQELNILKVPGTSFETRGNRLCQVVVNIPISQLISKGFMDIKPRWYFVLAYRSSGKCNCQQTTNNSATRFVHSASASCSWNWNTLKVRCVSGQDFPQDIG